MFFCNTGDSYKNNMNELQREREDQLPQIEVVEDQGNNKKDKKAPKTKFIKHKNQSSPKKGRGVEPNFRKFFISSFTTHWKECRFLFFERLPENEKVQFERQLNQSEIEKIEDQYNGLREKLTQEQQEKVNWLIKDYQLDHIDKLATIKNYNSTELAAKALKSKMARKKGKKSADRGITNNEIKNIFGQHRIAKLTIRNNINRRVMVNVISRQGWTLYQKASNKLQYKKQMDRCYYHLKDGPEYFNNFHLDP